MQTRPALTSDMNITPMIDVLLVLLVIFMAALPLSQRGLDVSLPQELAPPSPQPSPSVMLEITGSRTLSINRQPVTVADLGPTLARIFEPRRDKTLYLSGAPGLRYEEIVGVLDVAKGAGITNVGVITAAMRAADTAP